MTRKEDKRGKLIQTAKKLIHRQGYHQTTLADIAENSGITVGNIYYYFKTKEQLVQAIVDERTQRFKALTKEWEKEPNPNKRLQLFLEMPSIINKAIAEKGCPVGSLLQELNKSGEIAPNAASATIQAHLDWVTEQFRLLGKENPLTLAYNFISTIQGGCLLANSLNDPDILKIQIERLAQEIEVGKIN